MSNKDKKLANEEMLNDILVQEKDASYLATLREYRSHVSDTNSEPLNGRAVTLTRTCGALLHPPKSRKQSLIFVPIPLYKPVLRNWLIKDKSTQACPKPFKVVFSYYENNH